MKQLCTIQKRENLNKVYAIDEKGPGGACHAYCVCSNELDMNGTVIFKEDINFQKFPRLDKNSVHGFLDSAFLEIVRLRLTCFQAGYFSCHANKFALQHIAEALTSL